LYIERYAILNASGGNLFLNVYDNMGRRVTPQLSSRVDAIPPFDEKGMLPVVLLQPSYLFGIKETVKVGQYFRKPGRYRVV